MTWPSVFVKTDLSETVQSALKVDIKSLYKTRGVKGMSSSITKRKNTQILRKDMTFSFLPSSLCQALCQCNQHLLLINYSGLICDVIPAIELAEVPVLWLLFYPLGNQLYLTKYEIYHDIAKTLSFNMVYNLLLKGLGKLIY